MQQSYYFELSVIVKSVILLEYKIFQKVKPIITSNINLIILLYSLLAHNIILQFGR